jgi:hypothetical protein
MAGQRRKPSRSPSVQLAYTSTDKEEPALSPKAIRQLETAHVKWLKASDFAEAQACDSSVCFGVVHEIKRFLGGLGFSLTCNRSRCTWTFDPHRGGWIRVCSVDCSDGKFRLLGSAIAE